MKGSGMNGSGMKRAGNERAGNERVGKRRSRPGAVPGARRREQRARVTPRGVSGGAATVPLFGHGTAPGSPETPGGLPAVSLRGDTRGDTGGHSRTRLGGLCSSAGRTGTLSHPGDTPQPPGEGTEVAQGVRQTASPEPQLRGAFSAQNGASGAKAPRECLIPGQWGQRGTGKPLGALWSAQSGFRHQQQLQGHRGVSPQAPPVPGQPVPARLCQGGRKEGRKGTMIPREGDASEGR